MEARFFLGGVSLLLLFDVTTDGANMPLLHITRPAYHAIRVHYIKCSTQLISSYSDVQVSPRRRGTFVCIDLNRSIIITWNVM